MMTAMLPEFTEFGCEHKICSCCLGDMIEVLLLDLTFIVFIPWNTNFDIHL
jgi:hypothetical protein